MIWGFSKNNKQEWEGGHYVCVCKNRLSFSKDLLIKNYLRRATCLSLFDFFVTSSTYELPLFIFFIVAP